MQERIIALETEKCKDKLLIDLLGKRVAELELRETNKTPSDLRNQSTLSQEERRIIQEVLARRRIQAPQSAPTQSVRGPPPGFPSSSTNTAERGIGGSESSAEDYLRQRVHHDKFGRPVQKEEPFKKVEKRKSKLRWGGGGGGRHFVTFRHPDNTKGSWRQRHSATGARPVPETPRAKSPTKSTKPSTDEPPSKNKAITKKSPPTPVTNGNTTTGSQTQVSEASVSQKKSGTTAGSHMEVSGASVSQKKSDTTTESHTVASEASVSQKKLDTTTESHTVASVAQIKPDQAHAEPEESETPVVAVKPGTSPPVNVSKNKGKSNKKKSSKTNASAQGHNGQETTNPLKGRTSHSEPQCSPSTHNRGSGKSEKSPAVRQESTNKPETKKSSTNGSRQNSKTRKRDVKVDNEEASEHNQNGSHQGDKSPGKITRPSKRDKKKKKKGKAMVTEKEPGPSAPVSKGSVGKEKASTNDLRDSTNTGKSNSSCAKPRDKSNGPNKPVSKLASLSRLLNRPPEFPKMPKKKLNTKLAIKIKGFKFRPLTEEEKKQIEVKAKELEEKRKAEDDWSDYTSNSDSSSGSYSDSSSSLSDSSD